MEWERDRADWPHADASRFVDSRPHRWHIQTMGDGPELLLLHGTGGTTHGWAQIMPDLARDFRVIAVDLPGHGFTTLGSRHRSRPTTMAHDLWELLDAIDARPSVIVGHSAGAALALNMATHGEHGSAVTTIMGLNAALDGFEGAAGWLFPVAARAMASTPGMSLMLSRFARSSGRIDQMLDGTGSQVPDRNRELYRRLFSDSDHVDGTLEMMAQWTTSGLRSQISAWQGRLVLMVGTEDGTVAPKVSRDAVEIAQDGHLVDLGPCGHLASEESPAVVAEAIRDHAKSRMPTRQK